ncbi:MAG: ABC transporter substrate-binding protein [Bacteroidia bacterium]|nr:ABC transporter substrate-binding protein [Bacteroidia bacterium]
MLFVIAAIAASCTSGDGTRTNSDLPGPGAVVTRAQRFSLEKTDTCTILTITDPWQGANKIKQIYYLINRDEKKLVIKDVSSVVYVPLKKIICMSTTHLAMVAALGEEEAIAGVSGTDLIYDTRISQRIKEGLIYDVGYESGMNNELIISLSPDLIMIYGIGSESAGYTGKIKELGIKVMFNADYLETDPLGKAEWIKLFGALFCKEKMADSIFNSVSESYNRTKAYVSQNSKERPEVLLGLPFRDTWFISPGNSYAGKFIEDAGGNYLWDNTESSVSMPYSIEDVFLRALKADYWLNIGSVSSKKEISSLDLRLESIPCYRDGNIYNNNKRISPSGGNDYWESGIINPHLILKDIAAILHPELFPDTGLIYYRKIE